MGCGQGCERVRCECGSLNDESPWYGYCVDPLPCGIENLQCLDCILPKDSEALNDVLNVGVR